MSGNYTKGGWSRNIKPASKYPVIFAGRNTHVAEVLTDGLSAEEIEGNCDLVSAAPDLFEALSRAIVLIEKLKPSNRTDEGGRIQDSLDYFNRVKEKAEGTRINI